jgi:hypothetical protein
LVWILVELGLDELAARPHVKPVDHDSAIAVSTKGRPATDLENPIIGEDPVQSLVAPQFNTHMIKPIRFA